MSSDQRSDGWYVRRVREGDREAFRPLIERYEGMVYDLAHRFSDRSADSEDLAQEIFLRAYERIGHLEDPERFSSWLYSMALNYCRDYAKNVRRETYPMSETEQSEDDRRSDQRSVVDRLLIDEASDRLWEALDGLDPKYLVPLLLKYRDDLPYAVISERMDVSESALKVRVHRARKRLRERLYSDS